MRKNNSSRRSFLKGLGAAAFTLSVAPSWALQPTKRWRVGLIGTGWYGKSDLFRLMQVASVDVVALCDPDRNELEKAGRLVKARTGKSESPALFTHHEKMLEAHSFDIILIGSPDHWHALHTLDALKAGAHVYVQKPISVDVMEGEAMVAAARKYGKVVQVGTQRKSTPHLIEAKKNIVDSGLLGKIRHVEMCCYYPMRNNGNPPVQPIPPYFDYERWTGPAPMRPYDGSPHIRWWRTFKEYGNGITGDMCVHMLDTVRWLLRLGWPSQITSTGGIYVQKEGKSNISDTQTAIFQYDELQCVWQHRTWGTAPNPDYPWSFTLYGDKGTLWGSTFAYDFISTDGKTKIHRDVVFEREKYPEDLTEERIELHAAPATRGHMIDFLKAIEQNSRPIADIEEGHISTACCILANISMDLGGRPLRYDPKNRIVKDDPEATQLLTRPYRSPWIHPDPRTV